jgi:hypothetical protein
MAVVSNTIGCTTISAATFEGLSKSKSDFDSAGLDKDPTAIGILMKPWHYLTQVCDQNGLAAVT